MGMAAQITEADISAAIGLAWQIGRLDYRRRQTQKYLKMKTEQAWARGCRKIYWECTRRLGKSSELLATFTEHCLKTPNWRAGFFAPVKDGLKDYIEPVIEETYRDCPAHLRPRMDWQRFILEFS